MPADANLRDEVEKGWSSIVIYVRKHFAPEAKARAPSQGQEDLRDGKEEGSEHNTRPKVSKSRLSKAKLDELV